MFVHACMRGTGKHACPGVHVCICIHVYAHAHMHVSRHACIHVRTLTTPVCKCRVAGLELENVACGAVREFQFHPARVAASLHERGRTFLDDWPLHYHELIGAVALVALHRCDTTNQKGKQRAWEWGARTRTDDAAQPRQEKGVGMDA